MSASEAAAGAPAQALVHGAAQVLPAPGDGALAECRRTLEAGSKSFALASGFLTSAAADRAAVLYAWCRRADDSVDLCAAGHAREAVERLRRELDRLEQGGPCADPLLAAFGAVVRDCRIPLDYPRWLLDGMDRDASGKGYRTLDELLGYCFQVAGTVGLMMSHVLGVRDEAALRRGVHLGIAMQLTNVCRDVAEDWSLGRLYLPDTLCAAAGAPGLRARLGEPLERLPRQAIARVVGLLLLEAEKYYSSADGGLCALPWRAGLAIRAARRIYARIGVELARRGCDPLAGRTVVPGWRKALLALGATARHLLLVPGLCARRLTGRLPAPRTPSRLLRFPGDVLPL
jgi:15-cis-phytoene synthase